ncbi:hypothetical protein TWF481_005227 [Arthrobotrys musiformis]|uniref:Fucose-specific lectin n=1 Tax=Arthrobotrys musiformis TaxID=47236 RepID=A0AAV9WET7_9PEZI
MSWTSTHGVAVIAEDPNSFTVQPRAGYAVVSPVSAGTLEGKFHFTLPRPPAGYNNATNISIEFTSQLATVDEYHVYFGNKEKSSDTNLGWTNSQSQALASSVALSGSNAGIDVIVKIVFANQSSSINLWSIGLQYA